MFGYAFRQSRNAMVLLDERRVIVEVNGACLKLLGYARDDIIGHPIYEFSPDGPAFSAREWALRLADGDFTGERELTREGGSTIAVQWGAHTETISGHRMVLVVALNVERWGGRFRRDPPAPEEDAPLSDREREIVRHVSLGRSGPEIADELTIAHDTVRTHVRNAMEKVGARSRAHLVAKAIGDGHISD